MQSNKKSPDVFETMDTSVLEFKLNFIEEKKNLLAILTPMFEDLKKANSVLRNINMYIHECYNEMLSKNAVRIISYRLNKFLENIIYKRDYVDPEAQRKAEVAWMVYKDGMKNISTSGMGFSLITNSPLSAALFAVMDSHERDKQYSQQANHLNKYLMDTLSTLPTKDTCLSKNDIEKLLNIIDETLETINTLISAKKHILESRELYGSNMQSNKDSILATLRKYINGNEFIMYIPQSDIMSGAIPEDTIKLLGNEYVQIFYVYLTGTGPFESARDEYLYPIRREGNGAFFITTNKRETELVNANSSEENFAISHDSLLDAQLYQQAETFLEQGLYYEAATCFGKCSGYKDSYQRSLDIWKKKLFLAKVYFPSSRNCSAMTVNGNVLMNKTYYDHYSDEIKANEDYSKVSWYENIIDYYEGYGLTCTGETYGKTNFTDQIVAIDLVPFFVRRLDGRLELIPNESMETENVNDLTNLSTAGYDVKKIVGRVWNSRALITGGKVLKQGEYDKEATEELQKWEKIVDITEKHGLKTDGKVVTTEDYSRKGAEGVNSWENIIHIIDCFGCIGISSDGKAHIAYKNYIKGGNDDSDSKVPMYLAMYQVVKGWKNLVDVKIFEYKSHFNGGVGVIGLMANGQLVTSNVPYDLSAWDNIVSFYCQDDIILGVRTDGRILVAGKDPYRLNDSIKDWKLFKNINTYDQEKLSMVQSVHDTLSENITAKENELMKIRGLFTKKKKQILEQEITELEEKLSIVQYHIKNIKKIIK